ncbi:hypothetical protein N0V83_007611 [Neocucurbitaria cava]|uniref:Uncharacterized protein n=1 Tax=Neocucurbitaria cava TaxID=798079 RepID=A0A9W8Y6Q9_9PLEO|nr:hypothetical protein N0V83_007611 [Neocucurbitaria cava]
MLDYISTTHQEDVKDLEERSMKLMSINDAFMKFLKSRDRSETIQHIEVACFFEQYAMYKAKKKIGHIVPKGSACLPGIDPQSIQANHREMVQFEDEDREGYKSICHRLNQWISNLDKESKSSKDRGYSVTMGDVNYQDKIENNRGVVMGHAHSTATDGVRITGSSTINNYHGTKPRDDEANDSFIWMSESGHTSTKTNIVTEFGNGCWVGGDPCDHGVLVPPTGDEENVAGQQAA